MQFSCESCKAQLQIADEKVKGKQLIVRCRRCGAKIAIADPALEKGPPRVVEAVGSQQVASAPAPPQRSAPPPPPPPDGATWFAMLNGKQTGPLTRGEVDAKIEEAQIGPRTYLWREGMSSWQRARDVPDVSLRFPQPDAPSLPPPPPSAEQAQRSLSRSRQVEPRAEASPGMAPRSSAPGDAPLGGQKPETTGNRGAEPGIFAARPAATPFAPPDARDVPAPRALEKKAAELVLWASEELSKPPRAEQPLPQEALAGAAPGTSPERRHRPLLALVVLAILAAAALGIWHFRGADRDAQADRSAGGPDAHRARLSADEVLRRLDENRTALQGCIDDALRREPGLRVGKIHIATRIGPSGEVTSTKIDKSAVDESALGACLKNATRRIGFPAFSGEAFEVDIPVVVTAAE